MPWAVVTGASGGLGADIAERLAARKFDLILVARGEAGLAKTAARCTALGVKAELVPADLTAPHGVEKVIAALGKFTPIEVLVNNAGVGSYGRFWELDEAASIEQIDLNLRALVRLSRAVLPGMITSNRGHIINTASTAAFQSLPYFAVYGGTKAFVVSFTAALNSELRGSGHKGVYATAVCPGPMETGFLAHSGASHKTYGPLPWETPASVADKTVAALFTCKPIRVTGFVSRIIVLLNKFGPRFMSTLVSEYIFRPRK
jgi:short-subunit dehydrogenase